MKGRGLPVNSTSLKKFYCVCTRVTASVHVPWMYVESGGLVGNLLLWGRASHFCHCAGCVYSRVAGPWASCWFSSFYLKSCHRECWDCWFTQHYLAFYVDSGIQIQVVKLMWLVLLSTGHLPGPLQLFVKS